ncbi:4'-phosphopantetheinyl transferase [Rhizobium sp. LCM 4573]|uniref:4'-phosphopantetheinyl transferase family protein n=1 Tax=Rhizobium sp. LCM 4573 TaxID=1848291 RepID=UPI0008DA308E|nr:4'-phosphopantetheinyl transferase superfamily protein [Rhizobium sp. LCM 4573]OHV84979.1 hypothetical protein LCM4573_04890 [Rhizobium sp. LCM 4573]
MLLANLFDPAVAVSEAVLPHRIGMLYPEERAAIAGAVYRRRLEFSTGRACARQAMDALGLPAAAIPVSADRTPIWPEGITGSISHSVTRCAAAVARHSDGITAIGLDIEETSPLEEVFAEEICTIREREWLAHRPAGERGLLLKVIFCAKESAYKCQYPITKSIFDFDVLRIELDLPEKRFSAYFEADVLPFRHGDRLDGRIRFFEDHIAAGAMLR